VTTWDDLSWMAWGWGNLETAEIYCCCYVVVVVVVSFVFVVDGIPSSWNKKVHHML
jgi:hypothetical protein